MDDTMMAAALAYAERGWPVFPCHTIRDGKCSCGRKCGSPGKHPLTKNGHLSATTDPATIRKWWSQNPDANIAYAVQPDVAVLDVDIKPQEGKHGDETLAALEAVHGALPDTVRSLTGGGGVQYFFSCDPALGLTCSNPIRPGDPAYESIDLKTAGGYVILPPSQHISGRRYEWDVLNGPDDVEMAPLPQWAIDARIAPKGTTVHTVAPAKGAEGAKVYEGQRNDTLFKLASSLRAKGLSEAAMLAALMEENKARCEPPLPEDEVRKLTHSAGRYERGQVEAWERPRPFDEEKLPTFPVDQLPSPVSEYVLAVAEALQVSADMAAVSALATCAIGLQKKFVIEGKPDWREPLNLFTVVVAPPAERKTAVADKMVSPILDHEKTVNDLLQYEIDYYETEKSVLIKQIKSLEEKAAKGKATIQEVTEKRNQLSTLEEVHPIRLCVDDTTPEAIVSIMAENDGKIAVISAEGGIFGMMAGRYSDAVNIDAFLKAHSADFIRVDRKGRPSEYVHRPAMTMLLFAQPVVLDGLMGNDLFRGRGLVARFLYALPVSKVGRREFETQPIPHETEAGFVGLLKRLLAIEQPEKEDVIRLSPEAYKLSAAFAGELEPRLIGDLEPIGDWAGKLHGAILRIAGVLHGVKHPVQLAQLTVAEDTMQSAILIGKYFLAHALAAYRLLGADKQTADARYILRQLEKDKPEAISRRDLYRLCRGRFKSDDDMTEPVGLLEDYGYLRSVEPEYKGVGRKPSVKYFMNPYTFGLNGLIGQNP